MSRYKYTVLNDALADYLDTHRFDAHDPLLRRLQAETAAMEHGHMQIAADQGALMSLLVAATGARVCVEVGTFTGYSAICIARAIPSDGRLHCFDRSQTAAAVARRYWQEAGLDDRIQLHLGSAADTLPQFCPPRIDFAFIDADKTGYDRYYEFLLPRMRPGSLILFDNMLWHGGVIDPQQQADDVRAIRALNDKLTADPRVESVLLSLADGLHVCRRK